MAFQFSTSALNAAVDAIAASMGEAVVLELRSGGVPVNCAAGDNGALLASASLPSTWMQSAINGRADMTGTWETGPAGASGTVGHFRFKAGGVAHIQGSATVVGGGGDIRLSINPISLGAVIGIESFFITTRQILVNLDFSQAGNSQFVSLVGA